MTPFQALRGLHILLGTVALFLGPLAMFARKRPGRHTRAGEAYHWTVLAVCLSALGMSVLDWRRIWWFAPIAIFSYAFAFYGYLAAKRRWDGWLIAHIIGQGGSYIAMTTALLVVHWYQAYGDAGLTSPWPWLLPTIVGSVFISRAVERARGHRTSRSKGYLSGLRTRRAGPAREARASGPDSFPSL